MGKFLHQKKVKGWCEELLAWHAGKFLITQLRHYPCSFRSADDPYRWDRGHWRRSKKKKSSHRGREMTLPFNLHAHIYMSRYCSFWRRRGNGKLSIDKWHRCSSSRTLSIILWQGRSGYQVISQSLFFCMVFKKSNAERERSP